MKLESRFRILALWQRRKRSKTVAQKAEALGYNSLWTVERLLWPVTARNSPYPVTPDGSLPEEY